MNEPDERLHDALRVHFGHSDFRGQQLAVLRHVLAGGSALVVFPTGEGKSLCYQLPALLLPGLTLVLSPLIALMQDQVMALEQKGIPATFINSSLTKGEREQRLAAVVAGQVRLLYVTPERFRVPGFREELAKVTVSLLAVDEAHCVSQWGHDFRPDYSRVGEIRAALGNPPVLALTATATPEVQAEILARLAMDGAPVFHAGIERKNLFLTVREVASEEEKTTAVLDVCRRVGGPGIVYTSLIADLLRLEVELRRRGVTPLIYHGKLSPSERRAMHERFAASPDALVLATNAFGMGVDKKDIRFIVHHQLPGSIEAYYQEVGRAGRDGLGSVCELLFFPEDVAIQRDFVEWANPGREFLRAVVRILEEHQGRFSALDVDSLREQLLPKNRRDGRVETCLALLESAGCVRGDLGRGTFELLRPPGDAELAEWIDDGKRVRDLTRLLHVVRYARSETCRKEVIHGHFGFGALPGGCGSCDRCAREGEWLAASLPPEHRRPVGSAAAGSDARLARGDWIDVAGHGKGMVTRVDERRGRARIQVEMADDLEKRVFDLTRIRWHKL